MGKPPGNERPRAAPPESAAGIICTLESTRAPHRAPCSRAGSGPARCGIRIQCPAFFGRWNLENVEAARECQQRVRVERVRWRRRRLRRRLWWRMRRMNLKDRVGLAWRDELAAQIMLHLDSIDHLEIVAEREWSASRRRLDALHDLARQVPLSLHGVSLGLVSSGSVSEARLERIARLVERVEPDHWSEHLAFVRAGGFEIGHLAAAPYRRETLEGTLRNVERARRAVGSLPHLENIATSIRPPGSVWSEEHFIGQVLQGTRAPLLLDL